MKVTIIERDGRYLNFQKYKAVMFYQIIDALGTINVEVVGYGFNEESAKKHLEEKIQDVLGTLQDKKRRYKLEKDKFFDPNIK